jgi:hypothetical protein
MMMGRRLRLTLLCCLAGATLLACEVVDRIQDNDEPVVAPTVADFAGLQTAQVLTQNAPPPGFSTAAFPEIDDNLRTAVYSRVLITLNFDGAYSNPTAEDPSQVQSNMRIEIWNDEFNVARHVRIEFLGDVFSGESTNLDIVRLSNQYFMLNPNGVCVTDEAQIADIANIRAGQLIGGVSLAQPTGRPSEVINNYPAWQYGFSPENLTYPAVQTANELDILTGELWVAPEYNVAVRFTVEMNVRDAVLLFGARPVTGRLVYQYNVFDIGVQPNISVPNGC